MTIAKAVKKMGKKAAYPPTQEKSSTASAVGSRPKAPKPFIEKEVPPEGFWELRLYVAGQTPKSLAAMKNLQKICDEHLAGKYRIEVVDLVKNPQLAAGDQILAVPTLVRKLPEPIRKIIGDLSETDRVLVGLDVISVK